MEEERFIEMPEEWGGVIPSRVFLDEARRIVGEAEEQGIKIRVMGAVGIRLHTLGFADLAARLKRLAETTQEFTDLDFISYKRHRDRMKGFFESLGYIKRRATLSTAASERQIYFHPKGWFFIDVFFDKLLVANHPLDFRGRLELDSPTIPLTDLLIEKLQIVNFGEKDLKDTLVLLLAHEISDRDEREKVNAAYIAKLLAGDWGFWYTVTTNLNGIKKFLQTFEKLTEEEKANIASKVEALLDRIEKEPKTTGWKIRSMIGAKKRWYQPVETTETVGEFGIWQLLEKRDK